MEDEFFDLMIGDPVLINYHYNSIAGFESQQERAKVRFCSPDSIIVETLSGKFVPCKQSNQSNQSNIEFVKMSPEVAIQIGLTKIDDVTYRAGTPDNQHYITVEFDKEGNPSVYIRNGEYYSHPNCEYLHQFRHALMTCNIKNASI